MSKSATQKVEARLLEIGVSEYSLSKNATILDEDDEFDIESFNQVLCLELSACGKEYVLQAIEVLMQRDDVVYAGPDYILTIDSAEWSDPYASDQWAINKIDLPEAWTIETGDPTVKVGVIDTGIDANHEDLIGVVSEMESRDFLDESTSPGSALTDLNGHGTQIAGVIAAQGNNNIGITGVCWDITLVSLRAFESQGTANASDIIAAIEYAEECEIPILNLSAGYHANNMDNYDYALETRIRSFPGLIVCAAGNDGSDNDVNVHYPSNIRSSNLISVGASSAGDIKALFSNFGDETVDLFAPGDGILTCYPADLCDANCGSEHCQDGYHRAYGTSIACAMVTGVAALILSQYPTLTPSQIRSRIILGVDIVLFANGDNPLDEYCITGGRLNAYKAVHAHVYTYGSINAMQHTCSCNCGVNYTEMHKFKTYSFVDISGATITTTYCISCGYERAT